MKRILLAIAMAAVPQVAAAQPPATGTTHTFLDPVYEGTVFCDTFEQVREIVDADQPLAVYMKYLRTLNARNEPTCAAIVPTGVVLEVKPLGVMERDEKQFNAWAVKARVGQVTGYALYLEYFEEIIV